MAKTLAGVLAVSIAAMLFAGCSGGSTSAPTTSEAMSTTTISIDYAAQYLALIAPMNAARLELNTKLDVAKTDAEIVAASDSFAQSMREGSDSLLRSEWPDSVRPAIVQLAQTNIQLAFAWSSVSSATGSGKQSWRDNVGKLNGEVSGYVATVRALLKLPPVS